MVIECVFLKALTPFALADKVSILIENNLAHYVAFSVVYGNNRVAVAVERYRGAANDANVVAVEFVPRMVCSFLAFGADVPVTDIVHLPFAYCMPVAA